MSPIYDRLNEVQMQCETKLNGPRMRDQRRTNARPFILHQNPALRIHEPSGRQGDQVAAAANELVNMTGGQV